MRKFNLWKDTHLPNVLTKAFDARFGFSKDDNRIAGFVSECLCEVDLSDDTVKFNWYGDKAPAYSTIWSALICGNNGVTVYDNDRAFVKFSSSGYQIEIRYSCEKNHRWNKVIVKYKLLSK